MKSIKQIRLSIREILAGYDAVSKLYPHTPPLCLWRAWEFAGYRHFKLNEPVLDVGCGDGEFFRLVWPRIHKAVGIDAHLTTVEIARKSKIYSHSYHTPAHEMSIPDRNFGSAFANCSLEHMDHLPQVLKSIYNVLQPRGTFLLSVVTDNFLDWSMLPALVEALGEINLCCRLQDDYLKYHNVVNPLTTQNWMDELTNAGFTVEEWIPIVPEVTSRLFLFLDHLWHLKTPTGQVGLDLSAYFRSFPNFISSFRSILHGVLLMEKDWLTTSGVILLARKV